MEAIAEVATPEGVMVVDLARVFDEATAPRASGATLGGEYAGVMLIVSGVGLVVLGWAGWQPWHAEMTRGALAVTTQESSAFRRKASSGSIRGWTWRRRESARAFFKPHRVGEPAPDHFVDSDLLHLGG